MKLDIGHGMVVPLLRFRRWGAVLWVACGVLQGRKKFPDPRKDIRLNSRESEFELVKPGYLYFGYSIVGAAVKELVE